MKYDVTISSEGFEHSLTREFEDETDLTKFILYYKSLGYEVESLPTPQKEDSD